MKKIIVSLLIVLFIWIAGYIPKDIFVQEVKATQKDRFIEIYKQKGFSIVVDKNTRVMYLITCEGYSSLYIKGITVLVNADGKPLLYEGE